MMGVKLFPSFNFVLYADRVVFVCGKVNSEKKKQSQELASIPSLRSGYRRSQKNRRKREKQQQNSWDEHVASVSASSIPDCLVSSHRHRRLTLGHIRELPTSQFTPTAKCLNVLTDNSTVPKTHSNCKPHTTFSTVVRVSERNINHQMSFFLPQPNFHVVRIGIDLSGSRSLDERVVTRCVTQDIKPCALLLPATGRCGLENKDMDMDGSCR